MNELNNIGEGIGLIGLMGFYIWFKVWMYKREYKGDRDIVIKRGSEWDYNTKENENKDK